MATNDEFYRWVRGNLPCEVCPSSDGASEYADGHKHCWACGATFDLNGSPSQEDPEPLDWEAVPYQVLSIPRRGLTSQTCEKWEYGVTDRYHVANLRDAKGRLTGQKLRLPGKDFRVRGKITALYGQHLWSPHPKKKIIITEGELDALSMSQIQDNEWPVVSVLTGAKGAKREILAQLEWLAGFKEVVLMFDNDDAGREAAEECAKVLPPGKARIARLPLKDANDMLVAGRHGELKKAMWDAETWKPAGIVMGDAAWEYVKNRSTSESVPYGVANIDGLTFGHREGDVVVVCGGTGSGKSTLTRRIILDEAKRGHRVGVLALEETVDETALALCSQLMGKPLHLIQAAEVSDIESPVEGTFDMQATYEAFNEHLGDHVVFTDHQGSLDSEDLFSKMRYMVHGLGCRRIVLDHITIVVSNADAREDERKVIDRLMTRLSSFVKQLPVGVFVVCHLKRPEKGKSFEEGSVPRLNDLRGSSLIEALSMQVIATVRNQMAAREKDRNKVDFYVLKNRFSGLTGSAGSVTYDPTRCAFEEYVPEVDPDEFEINL